MLRSRIREPAVELLASSNFGIQRLDAMAQTFFVFFRAKEINPAANHGIA
jgi:hypothetical protein